MEPGDFFTSAFSESPTMAVVRGLDEQSTVDMCVQCWSAGIGLVEVPIQSPDALPSLEAAVRAGKQRGKVVGAGSISTDAQLASAHELGVAFTVAPGLQSSTVEHAHDAGIPHLPGVATSSEIQLARALGCEWLKAFPASALGTSWIKAQLQPFPDLRLVATGGVTPENASGFLAAGCSAVALGSSLRSKSALRTVREMHVDRTGTA